MYSIVLLVLMFALLYFFMIRPENKRKKQAQAMRDSLTVGDEITTIGGIIGTICAVKENTIVIETGADRVRIEFTKWAVSNVGVQTGEQPSKDSKDSKKKEKEEKLEEKKEEKKEELPEDPVDEIPAPEEDPRHKVIKSASPRNMLV